jgi:hypothetical protein
MAPPALATATSAHRANATSPQCIGPAAHSAAQRTAQLSAPRKCNQPAEVHHLQAGLELGERDAAILVGVKFVNERPQHVPRTQPRDTSEVGDRIVVNYIIW